MEFLFINIIAELKYHGYNNGVLDKTAKLKNDIKMLYL